MRRIKGIKVWFAVLFLSLFFGGGNPALAGQVFDDVSSGHWAEKAIAEMKVKGVVDGVSANSYQPGGNITREQVVAMLVRVMGLKDAAANKALPPDFSAAQMVSPWARGAVAQGLEEGVVAGADALDFRPGDLAKRYEIAVFSVRALGLTSEAQAQAGAPLDYSDAAQIPSWARGYVKLAQEQGIMSGSGGKFNPNDNVTRAEMAVVLTNLDRKLQAFRAAEVRGRVQGISSQLGVAESDGRVRQIAPADQLLVFRDGRTISWRELAYQEPVKVVLNQSGQAAFIEVLEDQDLDRALSTVQGTLVAASAGSLTVTRLDGNTMLYDLAPGATITVNGQSGNLNQIAPGTAVVLKVSGSVAYQVETAQSRTVEGTVKEADPVEETIVLATGSGEETFFAAGTTGIRLNGQSASLNELLPGQEAVIIATGQLAVSVTASSREWEAAGEAVEVSFLDGQKLKLKDDQGQEQTFKVAEDARIRRNGEVVSLREILPGDLLELELQDQTVVRLYADAPEKETSGTLKQVAYGLEGTFLTFTGDDGQEYTYSVAPGAEVRRSGKPAAITELRPGDYVELTLEGQLVVAMNVEPKLMVDFLVGTVQQVHQDARVVVVKDSLNPGQEHQVNLADGYEIYWSGRSRSLSYLEPGNQVVITGRLEGKVFLADTVVIVYR